MKNLLLLSVLVLASIAAFAQQVTNDKATPIERERRGYIGFTFGPAIPTCKDPKLTTDYFSTQAALGYLFSKNLGLNVAYHQTYVRLKADQHEAIVTQSIMAGPLFSLPAGKFNFDLRPFAGFTGTLNNWGYDGGFSYGIGANIRYHFARRMSLMFTTQYFATQPTLTMAGETFEPSLGYVQVGVGAAWRLR